MAKRFTDTEKWKKPWFRMLDLKHKVAWFYICDNCDHAGIWDVDMDLMAFQSGSKTTLDDLLVALGDRVRLFDGGKKLWVIPFYQFQYGSFKDGFRAKESALGILRRYGLIDDLGNPLPALPKDLPNSSLSLTEVSMDTPGIGIGIGIGKKGGVGGKQNFDFESLYRKYPRRLQKTNAVDRMERLIKTQDDFEALSKAIDRFADYHRRKGTETDFLPHMTTFLGVEERECWRDWLDPETGTSDSVAGGGQVDFISAIQGQARAVT